ncbi:MAG: GAF domain-containing sensor histidine kinase [Actinomycetia bacterium]|nr:GAF domain-containing sensor histidine kinase [Actinomycetes bacterium]
MTGLITVVLAITGGLMLMWPAMAVISVLGLGLVVDSTLALRTRRVATGPTLVADISFAGFAMVLVGVPSAAIGVMVAYFVLVVAVLGRSARSWWIGLYAIAVGAIVSVATISHLGQGHSGPHALVAGIIVVAVFGMSTIAMVREFVIVSKQGSESTGRRIEIADAIARASRAMVADDDAAAVARSLEPIREALDVSVVFVEKNVEDPEFGLCAVVAERVVSDGYVHPSLDRAAKVPWSEMPGARSHLEGGAPFLFRVEEARGAAGDRGGEAGLQVEVNIPIIQNGEWVGVVGAGDHDGRRVWRTDDLMLLRTLAGLISAFWQRRDDEKVRDSLIGSLDGRLRFEEALARSSRLLLAGSSTDITPALDAIGTAASVDEVVVTRTMADESGEPVAEVLAVWSPKGSRPRARVGDVDPYSEMPGVRDKLQCGDTVEADGRDDRRLIAGIEVGGGWFGSVRFIASAGSDPWTPRTQAFLRTIADIFGAFFERAQNRARLEQSLASKDQLIGSVSHELRTPLTAVAGLAEELIAYDEMFTTEERRELLEVIAEESREMDALVEDLLIAARSEDAAVPVFPEIIDLSQLVHDVLSDLTVPAGVRVTIADGPVEAFADPVRVRQIVRNLVTNALRYGGPNIDIGSSASAERVSLRVCDDGPGIEVGDREAVFEPYGRATGGATHKASVGLGLTLSRRLAGLMDGTLEYIDSDGATFLLTLPPPRTDPV